MADINELKKKFEEKMKELKNKFKSLDEEYFFTEKELHSYFYHLCLNEEIFFMKNGCSCVHAEYPTPFKCKKLKEQPYIALKGREEKNCRRSHLDLVLINPNFVNWVKENNKRDCIWGVRNDLFSDYIKEFMKIYENFQRETNEPILIYALEFKYFRHTVSGTKNPIEEIKYDLEKLKIMGNLTNEEVDLGLSTKLSFCANTRSLIFIRNDEELKKKISEKLEKSYSGQSDIITVGCQGNE